jgi:hypothetical protein
MTMTRSWGKKGKGLGCGFSIVYFEVSARTNEDVEDALITLFTRNAKKFPKMPISLSVSSADSPK